MQAWRSSYSGRRRVVVEDTSPLNCPNHEQARTGSGSGSGGSGSGSVEGKTLDGSLEREEGVQGETTLPRFRQ